MVCFYEKGLIVEIDKSVWIIYYFGRLERISLNEIEAKLDRFKLCLKCSSSEGFWLGVSHSHPYVQCKTCGAKFELFEIFRMDHRNKTSQKVEIFRR